MYKTSEIKIRDPYVVVCNDTYYMYKSCDEKIIVYKSKDLENWEEPVTVYEFPENSWKVEDLWAPEVHLYKDKYYLFVTSKGRDGNRGTDISVADTPDGMFVPITDKPATPEGENCIDGTLYVENDVPYIVYSDDWISNYDEEKDCYIGAIWAQELTEDLKERVGEPFLLFNSDEAPWDYNIYDLFGKDVKRYGSDGPFLTKLSDGTLYLIWSPSHGDNYIVASVVSDNGSIKGKWTHLAEPLFGNNGGHGMFFKDLNGNMKLSIHWPEKHLPANALFLDVIEENKQLKLIFE